VLWFQDKKETQRKWELGEIAGTILKSSSSTKGGHWSCRDSHQQVGRRKPTKELVFFFMVALPANTA